MKIGEVMEVSQGELEALLERVEKAVARGDFEVIRALADTVGRLSSELEKKNASIGRLRDMLFGKRTESTKKVFPEDTAAETKTEGGEGKGQPPRKGHGRNGAEEYTGAKKTRIDHVSLNPGDSCPGCGKGKVYEQTPHRLVRVTGQAPIGAEVTECQCLRCNLCGEVFTAEAPASAGSEKYDEAAGSMIALLRYGSGLPFWRLEKLQESLGVPLPAATQWEIVSDVADEVEPIYQELIRQAAQGEVFHNDDTNMRILTVDEAGEDQGPKGRKGIFTSGIIARVGGREIALFFTGKRHAGENLLLVLKRRSAELGPPIQMCDALSRNFPQELETILANCLGHARRKFVEVVQSFPGECRHVLECLKEVYHHDTLAKGLSPVERLRLHQEKSGPVMERIEAWLRAQLEDKKVEPNSGLGEAIGYMLDHWEPLTLFLREAGAPLDNNVCERALKMAILHRKNSYFYKTENGARVGDIFMSVIHTCRLSGVNPFEYLRALQKNAKRVRANPADWLPWSYQAMLGGIEPAG